MVPASPMVPVKRARPSKTVGFFTTNKPRNINHHAPELSLGSGRLLFSKSLTTDRAASPRAYPCDEAP